MIKKIVVFIPALICCMTVLATRPEEKVKAVIICPLAATPGAEFTVTVNIHSNGISGFARLQQDLPKGFTAIEKFSHGADFEFENNSLKFNWSQVPADTDFSVSYTIKTEPGITGQKNITGIFAYMEEGKTQKINFSSDKISFDNMQSTISASPEVDRKMISTNKEIGEYKVELVIHPNGKNEPAQFADAIPEKFSAEVADSHGADFKFENHSVTFDWKSLPAEKQFTISYMIKSGTPGIKPEINGVLTFGNTVKEILTAEPKMQETTASETFTEVKEKAEPIASAPTPPAKELTSSQDVKDTPKEPATATQENTQKISPSAGIVFRIQISATQHSSLKDSKWFDEKFKINSDVEMAMHDGWKKYLIGNFSDYNLAAEFKKQMQEKVSDAFIVAYKNGERISIPHAMQSAYSNSSAESSPTTYTSSSK